MNQLKFFMFLVLLTVLFIGCIETTTNGSPELIEDDSTVTDYVRKVTHSEAVELWAVIKRNSNQEVKSAELRIDLIRPNSFSSLSLNDNVKAKQLIGWLNEKLKNPKQYNAFSLNEITEPTNTLPAPNIAKTIKLKRSDL